MSPSRASTLLRLARWLGPWSDPEAQPKVRRSRARVQGNEPLDMWCYRPLAEDPSGALLVMPGLHYLGPADPRFDRFLAVLANAGIAAYCPFLPEFRRLSVGPSLVDDALASLDLVTAREGPVGVFSISFGSYPAIHLAARRPEQVRALTLFGGYARFEDVIRFSLVGHPDHPHDPLNRPVVFLNLLEHLPDLPDDREPLRRAWVRYVRRTWGKPWMKQPEHWRPVSDEIAERVPEVFRRAFEQGTGAAEGGEELAMAGLERGRETLTHLDVMETCAAVRCPVNLVHGRDDDVIPHSQSALLEQAMAPEVPTRLLLTGLYGHTAAGMVDPSALGQELRAMVGILEAIADSARG